MNPLLSAHLITSEHAAARELRQRVVAHLAMAVAPAALLRETDNEPDDVKRLIEATGSAQPPLVVLDPAGLDDAALRPMVRNLHLRQVSNTLKHVSALRKVASLAAGGLTWAPGAARYALVLEDDALCAAPAQVAAALRAIALSAPQDADVVFLGLPSPNATAAEQAARQDGAPMFVDAMSIFRDQALPACESYLVTPAAAERIAAAMLPVRLTTTGMLTYLARRGVFRGYVACPNIFMDGSKTGALPSSLEANNQLLWHAGYCQMEAIVRRGMPPPPQLAPSLDTEGAARFEELWRASAAQLEGNPDALALRGEYLERLQRVDEARDAYEAALRAYERDGCIVNSSSAFLRRLMCTYAHDE